MSYPGHSLVGVLPLCREAVGAFYSPSRLGKRENGFTLKRAQSSEYPTQMGDYADDIGLLANTPT